MRDVPVTGVLGVAMALLVSCAPAADNEPLRTVNQALGELQLPASRVGAMASDSVWHVFVDTGATPRLLLIRQVAALVLPDGPFEMTEPVTAFRFTDGRWQQLPGPQTERLPAAVERPLVAEFVDRERTYFFHARAIPLGGPDASTEGLAERVRTSVASITRNVARYRTAGFISGDAEP